MSNDLTADLGGRLRHARLQRGLSVQDVGRLTKLSIHLLQAIERNDFESLPGGIYRKAYLRTLAGEVGLKPNEIAKDYEKHFEPAIEPPVEDRATVRQEEWVRQLTPSPRRSVATLAILITLATVWFAWPGSTGPIVAPAPAAGGLIAVGAPVDGSPAIPNVRDAAQPVASPRQADAPLRIEMAATGWCWVAAEADGERVLYRLMEPGERFLLEGQRLISLRLGDAGSVTLSINDGARRSIGRHGEVVELELTPDNVEGVLAGAAS